MPDLADTGLDPVAVTPDVIVVGAGIAGLTAARDLALGGLSVTVIEAAGSVGGKVSPHMVGSVTLDAGAESFATRHGTVEALLREIGLADDLVAPHPAGAWLLSSAGRAHPLPRTGILGIPSRPMSREVIAVIGWGGALRAQLDSLLPGVLGSRERRLGPLVRKRMGRRLLDGLVAPVTTGIHSRHPDELEVDAVAPGLRTGLRDRGSLAKSVLALRAAARAGSSVAGLRGGIHRIAGRLGEDLAALGVDIRLHSTVVAEDSTGVTIEGGERILARLAVLSSAPAAGEGVPITLATLVVHSAELDVAPRGTGVLVARGTTGIRAKALTHATAKWAWLAEQAGEHLHVLRLSYEGLSYEGLSASDQDLAELARTDAERLLGLPIPASAVRGFARKEWRSAATTGSPSSNGVTMIGETVSGTGLAAVIAQARETAAKILSGLSESPSARGDDGEHDIQPNRH